MSYNSNAKVLATIDRFGVAGGVLVEIFNDVDPLLCFYDYNVDEYCDYINRTLEALEYERGTGLARTTKDLLAEIVRRSFYPSQVAHFLVTPEKLDELVDRIWEVRDKLGFFFTEEDMRVR